MPPNNVKSEKSNEEFAMSFKNPNLDPSSTATLHKSSSCNLIVNAEENFVETSCRGNGTVCSLVGELLCDIYGSKSESKRKISGTTCDLSWQDSDRSRSSGDVHTYLQWISKDINDLKEEKTKLERQIAEKGNQLVKYLKKKNLLLMRRETHYDVITAYVQAVSPKTREDTKMKFSLSPGPETGFSQWLDAMKMVAQLPGGMPSEFRTKLWLQLSEKHLNDQKVDWDKAEAVIFNEWTNPDDEELGVQIVKDLHRTGCSLFCGEQEHNQALLKRVLLAYARWNKNVGYCQGFNMLAALILQVMEKHEKNAVKVMIYLIEGVLPESYFANNLRGLSVDMAVFRDLLRLRLPKLSKHLEALQHDTNSGTSYEPPLTNVFTMQWFLTLFSNCLPQQTVLRVWDLVFLYGNEVLLRTALAIWGILQDRVITVESADEFYSIMGVVTREMLEFGLMDANALVKMIAMVDPFPNELQELREKYLYNISPWTQSVQGAARKGIKLLYGDPDDQDDTEDEDKIAFATAYGVFRRQELSGRELQISGPTLDIGILKQQYAKLRQRQRQAHVIITAACSSHFPSNITSNPSVSVNHLLMGKSALVNKGRRIGPPEGSIPPNKYKKEDIFQMKDDEKDEKARLKDKILVRKKTDREYTKQVEKDTIYAKRKENAGEHTSDEDDDGDSSNSSSSSSTSTELCDDGCSDSEADSDALGSSQKINDAVQNATGEPVTFSIQNPEIEINKKNIDCDTDKLLEIREVAKELVNSIEKEVQNSEKLRDNSTIKDMWDVGYSSAVSTGTTEVQNNFLDNTKKVIHLLDSDNLIEVDNTERLEIEVPINQNVIKNSGKEKNSLEDLINAVENEIADINISKKKSDLGLNIMRENLQILHKFSQRTSQNDEFLTERETDKSKHSNFIVQEYKNENESEVTVEDISNACEIKYLDNLKKTDFEEPILPISNSQSSCLSLTKKIEDSQKPVKAEKVNKEVNTEITFGVEEVEFPSKSAGVWSLDDKSESSISSLRGEDESSMVGTPRRYLDVFYEDKEDEVASKLEISKSDWLLKMKKIAELETSTREALNEMQEQSLNRKTFHLSLHRNSKQRHLDYDFFSSPKNDGKDTDFASSTTTSTSRTRTASSSSNEDIVGLGRLKYSSSSFDAITSRTEKLLGNVEFDRSSDDSFNSDRIQLSKQYKSKVYQSECNQGIHGKCDLEPKKLEFPSSPNSSEDNFMSTYESPIRHSSGEMHTSPKSVISGNSVKTKSIYRKNSKEFSWQKYSPDRKPPVDSSPEVHPHKSTFNPFPTRSHSRPKEFVVKLGLYPTSPETQQTKKV